MDVRDITEKVVYPEGRGFTTLFELQEELLKEYRKIEKLPPYPVDINTRAAQDLLKDFSGRIIEELGEGFESYLTMLDMFHKGVDESKMIPFLQNFNEEIADATHFWLEIMIYSGFDVNSVRGWVTELIDEEKSKPVDLLETWVEVGGLLVNREIPLRAMPSRWVIKDHQLKDEFLRGGRQLSKPRRDYMKQYLWDITYHLQIARNTLKNKPWKQTEMMTDVNQYEISMKGVCIAYAKFLYFTGFSHHSFYEIYYKKNRVNLFRIRSKY